jgi:hypothetical protein
MTSIDHDVREDTVRTGCGLILIMTLAGLGVFTPLIGFFASIGHEMRRAGVGETAATEAALVYLVLLFGAILGFGITLQRKTQSVGYSAAALMAMLAIISMGIIGMFIFLGITCGG